MQDAHPTPVKPWPVERAATTTLAKPRPAPCPQSHAEGTTARHEACPRPVRLVTSRRILQALTLPRVRGRAVLPSAALASEDLDVQAMLDLPGVRLVAVEFFADWCGPCRDAAPKWKAFVGEVPWRRTADYRGPESGRGQPGQDPHWADNVIQDQTACLRMPIRSAHPRMHCLHPSCSLGRGQELPARDVDEVFRSVADYRARRRACGSR